MVLTNENRSWQHKLTYVHPTKEITKLSIQKMPLCAVQPTSENRVGVDSHKLVAHAVSVAQPDRLVAEPDLDLIQQLRVGDAWVYTNCDEVVLSLVHDFDLDKCGLWDRVGDGRVVRDRMGSRPAGGGCSRVCRRGQRRAHR